MNSLPTIPLFSAGQIVATPGALALLEQANQSPLEFLSRHLRGDWGDLCPEDKEENELSVDEELRILSAYHLKDGTKIWIITEADGHRRASSCRANISCGVASGISRVGESKRRVCWDAAGSPLQ